MDLSNWSENSFPELYVHISIIHKCYYLYKIISPRINKWVVYNLLCILKSEDIGVETNKWVKRQFSEETSHLNIHYIKCKKQCVYVKTHHHDPKGSHQRLKGGKFRLIANTISKLGNVLINAYQMFQMFRYFSVNIMVIIDNFQYLHSTFDKMAKKNKDYIYWSSQKCYCIRDDHYLTTDILTYKKSRNFILSHIVCLVGNWKNWWGQGDIFNP
jgi:hypothetical protein